MNDQLLYLGIEGGGTRSTLVLADSAGKVHAELAGGPANLRLMTDAQLLTLLRLYAGRLPLQGHRLGGIAIGLAGARSETDLDRIRKIAGMVWPGIPCHATNDLDTALHAAAEAKDCAARVLILSGTGSCCFGRSSSGQSAKVGGRGHVIGDRGSACDIAQQALKALMAHYDHTGDWPLLGSSILASLQLNDKEDLIAWSMQPPPKADIAALAICVFSTAGRGDPVALELLQHAAQSLADDGLACAARLADPGQRVQFIFNGGVLLKNPSFMNDVSQRLHSAWPDCVVSQVEQGSAWGAYTLAKNHSGDSALPAAAATQAESLPGLGKDHPAWSKPLLLASPTEQRNPRSLQLSSQSIADSVELMLSEDATIPAALLAEKAAIVTVVERISAAFKAGGRLFYTGAGTSGRLGVLDASECPPTFRAPSEQVQGIIAGGQRAIWSAVEGAEDDVMAGASVIEERGISGQDVLIGIAASGRTPFVWGALCKAQQQGTYTVLVTFNPGFKDLPIRKGDFHPDLILAPNLGPEVLTGSTRLKSGTATKLLLNLFTTLAMVQSGKVISNLMVDLNPSNVKLRIRAVGILQQLTGKDEADCQSALQRHGWVVKAAYESLHG
jgi:N-acetylmuramic acid 6-phosphate etherase